ncbi:MAG: DoxX family protein [bacterium]|nr:DoxX family protein [bacterium]
MKKIINCSCLKKCSGFAPTVLRVVVGLTFFLHGWQKLTQIGPAQFGGFLSSLGVPMSGFFGYVVTSVEFLGGIALILGLLTHLSAKLLAINMLVALFLVHIKKGFFVSGGGMELVLLLLAATVSILLSGPGKWAVDNYFKKK